MICRKCGKEIHDDEASCPYCGKDVDRNIKKYNSDIKTVVTIQDVFVNFFKKAFTINDVATIKEFIIIFLIHTIRNVLLGVLNLNTINTALNLIFLIPILSLIIRRYHDANLSGIFSIFYGGALLSYFFAFFMDKDYWFYTLMAIALLFYAINFILLLTKTNPKSRWNKYNGYM